MQRLSPHSRYCSCWLLIWLPCPQNVSLVLIVPSKGKQGREESKTSLVGLRCCVLIGIWGVSCWLQRCGLKALCWSQGEPAAVLLPSDDRLRCLLTTASQESCAWTVWAEQRRKMRCLCLRLTQWGWWPWSRSTQDHTKEHQTHCSGTLSGENSAQIPFACFGERFKPSSFMSPNVHLETAVKGLNWNSSRRRDKGKLWPSCCQILLWAGQDRGWRSISDLQESTSCPRPWLLFSSPIGVLCCRVELPDRGPEHRHILKAKICTWLWQGPFFPIFILWLSQLLPPQLVPDSSRPASSLHGQLDFVHSTQWIPPLSTVAKDCSTENRKAFSKWVV